MQPFIDKGNTSRKTIASHSEAARQGASDIQVKTDTGKLAFKTEQRVLVNASDSTHLPEEVRQNTHLPELPRKPRDTHPLINPIYVRAKGIKERHPRFKDQIQTINKKRTLIKNQHLILSI